MNSLAHNTQLQDRGALRASLVFAAVILFGMGLLYSLTSTAIGRSLFPQQATGSIVTRDGKAVGSSLIAQPFADARYFQPRPSAAGYDPMSAAGSNQARTNPDLRKRIAEITAAVAARDGVAARDVPGELVTQSGGGLDPDLSPAGAQVQIARVARARNLDPKRVAELVAAHTQGPQFGFLGQPRVNVLEINLALDAKK
ncbi:potassium-transporting ATPase subunit KdpC [Pseudoxanthomonas sacheonensis]|uniref:Potassium-transporting ATPase KdpC subunit n=1 Tax=Pseudoxanthomonas sacheonensis TaxID=443615 RepID=A0ABU1RV53_9GAMM|nr:potassium-transporting ATPase subunit KdpC [Pseudoxanthomonas sacheonensis]MDR6842641.1 K+-transporting ATPase ATPase C chain [Pseudoxanthomonas sacheonensis]